MAEIVECDGCRKQRKVGEPCPESGRWKGVSVDVGGLRTHFDLCPTCVNRFNGMLPHRWPKG